jgi:hypothetical protein
MKKESKDVELSLLLVTIGRPTLKAMLESIKSQIRDIDYLTIIVDGPKFEEDTKKIVDEFDFDSNSICKFNFIVHPENLGYWGHPIRNIYQTQLKGDFILHCDDDDIYLENAFDDIREAVSKDLNKMYVFKMWISKKGNYRWFNKAVVMGNIGTPMGIIPNKPECMGRWKDFVGGDGRFFEATHKKLGTQNVEFVDKFIYRVRPHV